MAYWIKSDGTITEVHPAEGPCFTLEEVQHFVGGYIEIAVTHTGDLMVVNEEGKLHGLPFNLLATERYRFGGYDPIVGNVLIATKAELEPEE